MKRIIKDLIGFKLGATDGEIGQIIDFYFDDGTWEIRYIVVETGSWLSSRKVLISPESLSECDWENETFPVNLTKEQIKTSPSTDSDKPISEQHEIELRSHYSWSTYQTDSIWSRDLGTSGMMLPMSSIPMEEAIKASMHNQDTKNKTNPNLQSATNVSGYAIHATDGTIGNVESFIIEDTNWQIHYLIVDTGNWFPGKKVTISLDLVKEVIWETSEVVISAAVEQVKNSPEYDPTIPLTAAYESTLKSYYAKL